MSSPRLSIIIPAYNSAKTLKYTLDSVISQRFDGLECWVIDGKSLDGTAALVEEYRAKNDFINLVSEPDKGIYDAMNKGINISKGDYLYFMGSDDVFYNDTVLTDVFSQTSSGQYDLIYGDIVFKHSRLKQGWETNYLKLIKNLDNINHQSIFYSRRVFSIAGHYDLNFPIYADFNLNIKCFKNDNLSKKYIGMPVCIFNEKGSSFYYRNRDNYIKKVHEMYVSDHEDPVALYDTVKQLEAQLATILGSKDYLLGKKIGNMVRRLRRILRFK